MARSYATAVNKMNFDKHHIKPRKYMLSGEGETKLTKLLPSLGIFTVMESVHFLLPMLK